MGNKQSFTPPSLPVQLPQAKPASCPPGCAAGALDFGKAKALVERATVAQGNSDCQTNDAQLSMARNDVRQKDEKWEKCYPELSLKRRLQVARDETNAYSEERRQKRNEANVNYQTKSAAVEKLATSAREFYKTLFEKEKELASLVGKRMDLEQLERRERRAFLDNDPQGGVGGAPGVRTMDDRVLLAFWITYGAALLSATMLGLQIYGARVGVTSGKAQTTVAVVVGIIGYAIPYYFINAFG
jgi:hypothetical protein